MPSCRGQDERNSQLTTRQKDGDALDIVHQTPQPHCRSSRPGAKYNDRPSHLRHIWRPWATSRLERETYLDIGAQDRNPYRACSSSNPTHHIGSLSYMCINLPRNAGECNSRPVCRIAIDVFFVFRSQPCIDISFQQKRRYRDYFRSIWPIRALAMAIVAAGFLFIKISLW